MNRRIGHSLSTTIVVSLLVTFVAAVPEWHMSDDGRQYLIESAQNHNWHEAHEECIHRGLQLVEIQTAQKNIGFEKLLRQIFKKSPDLWIGATDFTDGETTGGKGRPFYWALRKQPVTFTHWGNGQPDNTGGIEHCVQIFSRLDFKWNDRDCKTGKLGYVCETRFDI